MNIEHQRVNSIGDLKRLRLVYLDSLIHQQELYLELMVQKSKYYIIKVEDSLAGYFILYQDKTIVEFYLDNHHVKDDQAIFKEIIQSLKVKSIICKSYDHLLMKLSIEQFRTSKALGYLFRDDIQHRDFSQDESVTTRKAEKQDLPHIVKLKEGVFESNEEIVSYIDKKKILIFEKGDRLLGFGIHSRTVEDRD